MLPYILAPFYVIPMFLLYRYVKKPHCRYYNYFDCDTSRFMLIVLPLFNIICFLNLVLSRSNRNDYFNLELLQKDCENTILFLPILALSGLYFV